MKHKITLYLLFFILSGLFTSQKTFSQCPQIESILVDACDTGSDEGFNEMVRFKVGTTAINTSNLSVIWPANSWQGLVQNATTASKVALLNAQIFAAGGCGKLIEGGDVLPANSKVILVSSYNFNVASNYFGAISDNIYILFQNNATTSGGHFANYNTTPGLRTLTMSFGGGCSDSVVYQRTLLKNINGGYGPAFPDPSANALNDGATVNFTPAGIASYVNNGCVAPVEVFSVDAGNSPITACPGATISLLGLAEGQQSVSWSASSGSFSSPTTLVTNYTIDPAATGSITLTLKATNTCSRDKTDTIIVNVNPSVAPTFTAVSPICSGASLAALPTTSNNSIAGTWSPALDNTVTKTYTFTPTAGQCASATTLTITVNPSVTPTFTVVSPICSGASLAALPITSNNSITGTWSPALDNTVTKTYTFTPTAGQCASATTLTITVNPSVTPTFTAVSPICSGSSLAALPTTSNNSIAGTWSPALDNTVTKTYTFTPTAGQCSTNVSMTIVVAPVFDFDISGSCVNGSFVLEAKPISNSFDSTTATFQWKDQLGNNVGSNESTLDLSKVLASTSAVEEFPLTYSLQITPAGGCPTTKSYKVSGVVCNIPKGISPDGNSKNDEFDLTGLGVKELHIFNRYGTEVYNLNNYTKQWHGQTNSGEELPDGTYFYSIHKLDGTGTTGWVYINRKQ